MRRISAWAAISSGAVSAWIGRRFCAPVVASSMARSAAASG
jgi:hypothetical protein